MDRLTPEQRKKNMQAVKSKGSVIEKKLAKGLWNHGLRYRKNNIKVFGKPDLTFNKYKIAIFVDSEFWHGKDWDRRKYEFKSNQDFWIKKIERNIQRDVEVNEKLQNEGWTVLRFWGKEIEKNAQKCINQVIDKIDENKRKH